MEQVKAIPKVKLHTSLSPEWSGAIGLVSVEGKKPGELDSYLFNQHKIHTTSIEWENIKGVRITPNVYTTKKNLDTLVQGIREFAGKA
jgi:selenocysteine lyase/cysteine desulfurase